MALYRCKRAARAVRYERRAGRRLRPTTTRKSGLATTRPKTCEAPALSKIAHVLDAKGDVDPGTMGQGRQERQKSRGAHRPAAEKKSDDALDMVTRWIWFRACALD